MDGFGDFLPGSDLFCRPNSGGVSVTACFGSDECRFGDQERAWNGATLCVVFGYEWERNMGVVCTESSKWCQDDAILELDVAQFQRLEEVGGRHIGICECVEGYGGVDGGMIEVSIAIEKVV